jgi:DNA invertase Pin-like site-specific DNA recombinase
MSAKLIGYARVSTTDQSLDVQLQMLQFNGCDRIFQEHASGADRNRPQLAHALAYLQAGDTLIVCKLDRIARNTAHLLEIAETLKQRDVTFRILNINMDTSTPTGSLMLTVLGAVATFERDIMFERQAEGIKRAKAAGVYKGKSPVIRDAATPRVLTMRADGIPHRDIATSCGIGVATVYRICKRAAGGVV